MGFIFRGKHSYRDIGVKVDVTDLPISPPKKTEFEEGIPYRDGSIDFSETGGRVFYKDKTMQVTCYLINSNTVKRNKQIERFVSWINGGKGELILDDMPFVKWIATPIEVEDMTIMLQRAGKTTVAFRCEPFNQFIYDTNGIPLGTDIALDTDVAIGWPLNHYTDITSGTNTFTIENEGSAAVRPVFELNGKFKSITIKVGGNELKYEHDATSITVDCNLFSCFENGVNTTNYSDGDFTELSPGENKITVEADGEGTMQIVYNPLFFYDELILGELVQS